MERSKIDRINELARKAKAQGLTDAEKEEQQRLRKEYIASFRQSLINTLDQLAIIDTNGNRTSLRKKGNGNLLQ